VIGPQRLACGDNLCLRNFPLKLWRSTNIKNEILQEVWKNRDKFARHYKYDLNLMVKSLQKVEQSGRNPIADEIKKKPKRKKDHSAF
jgi:hypothetical protein